MELRHISLGWLFYDSVHILRMPHGIVYHSCSPAVAVFSAGKIDCVAACFFADKYAIAEKHGVHGVVNGVGDGVAV